MKVIRNNESGTWTLVPVEEGETAVIAAIAQLLKPEKMLYYDGRTSDDVPNAKILHFRTGLNKDTGVKLLVQGTEVEDKREINLIRDACYWGSGGLIFLVQIDIEGKQAIVTTAIRCKHCGVNMLNALACEWRTCDTCAAKCDHVYVRGAVHGGDIDLGVGDFCSKCGRGRPKKEEGREPTLLEHHLAASRELGIEMIYTDGPVATPVELVAASRLARRHAKSHRHITKK